MSLNSATAVQAALFTNDGLEVIDDVTRVVVIDDTDDLTATSDDPCLEFSFKPDSSVASSTFTIGFRAGAAANWSAAAAVTVNRSTGVVTDVSTGGSYAATVGSHTGGDFVHVRLKPTALDALAATEIELSIDLEGGAGVTLYNPRLTFSVSIA